jgi:hypothetical protein
MHPEDGHLLHRAHLLLQPPAAALAPVHLDGAGDAVRVLREVLEALGEDGHHLVPLALDLAADGADLVGQAAAEVDDVEGGESSAFSC